MSQDINEDLRRAIGADQIPQAIDLLATAQYDLLRKVATCDPSEFDEMRSRCYSYSAAIDALLIVKRAVTA